MLMGTHWVWGQIFDWITFNWGTPIMPLRPLKILCGGSTFDCCCFEYREDKWCLSIFVVIRGIINFFLELLYPILSEDMRGDIAAENGVKP